MTDDRNRDEKKTKFQTVPIDDKEQWWLRYVPSSKEWSDVNISRFLSIYRTHPVLWDPTNSFYKDKANRMKAYSAISRKLNSYGIREKECIKLTESMRDLYMKEKKRQTIARNCTKKLISTPIWYCMLEEIVESVQKKLEKPVLKDNSSAVKVEAAKPWEACCPRLYTEDIWTPKHFKTDVTDWFLASQNEQLLCTCKKSSGTVSNDIFSTETSSVCCTDSTSDSSREINQCVAESLSHYSGAFCFDKENSKLPKQCGERSTNSDETLTCCNATSKRGDRISSFCKSYAINDTKIRRGQITKRSKIKAGLKNVTRCCPSINLKKPDTNVRCYSSEASYSDTGDCDFLQTSAEETRCEKNIHKRNTGPLVDVECETNKRQKKCNKTPIVCKNSGEDYDSIDFCGNRAVEKSLNRIGICPEKNASLSDEPSLEICGDRNSDLCGLRKLPKFCVMQATTCGNSDNTVCPNGRMSSTTDSLDTCRSDDNSAPATVSADTSTPRSSQFLESISSCEKEESDHRLDYEPNPTLCEKCAVDRVPVGELHDNIKHYEDPREMGLDKYCYYRDWDAVYNIRTKVPDQEPIMIQIDEDLLLMMRHKDEPPMPKRLNHLSTEADLSLFIDPASSEARQVSLYDEYKREYGLSIRIDQPRHYACQESEAPGHRPAQLIL